MSAPRRVPIETSSQRTDAFSAQIRSADGGVDRPRRRGPRELLLRSRPRAVHGHPQDPAHRHHHAGEPLVRHLLRHVPGADGIPMKNGVPTVCVARLRNRAVRSALRRPRRCQRWGPARRVQRDGRHQQRPDERLHRPGPARPARACVSPTNPACAELGEPGRDGLPHRRATSPTTGRTRRTSCSRTTCSSPTRRGACRHTFPGLGVVGRTAPDDNPSSCANASESPGARRPTSLNGQARRPSGRTRSTRGPT